MSSRIKVESSRIERQDGQSTEQASVIKDSDTCMPTLCCQVARGIAERLMKESDYQLTDDGSRVQRVLIKSAEQRRTQSLSMRRRVKTCTGDKDHDVELVTATHMNPHHSETYRRNTRDRLHVEIDVRTTTAKDTTSVMAKLMGATEESTSGVTDHGRIHATSRGEQCSHFLSWQAECRKQVNDESLQVEGWLHGVDGFDPQTTCRQTTSESTKQLGEPPSESTKPAPTPSVPGGPNEENVELENPFGRSLITLKMVAPQKELNVELLTPVRPVTSRIPKLNVDQEPAEIVDHNAASNDAGTETHTNKGLDGAECVSDARSTAS